MRDLYDKILDYEGEALFAEVLKPWVEDCQYEQFIHSLRYANVLSTEESWELYALSKVLDVLTLGFAPNKNADGSTWLGSNISIGEYEDFLHLLELETSYPPTYNSYNCEIVESVEGAVNFSIIKYVWPTVKLTNLLIKRGGVIITNDSSDYKIDLINNATLYWASWRNNRARKDLSDGWGSNSRWRTDFRFDKETSNSFIYNTTGIYDLNLLTTDTLNELREQNLEIGEAIELLTYGHFVRCNKDDSDLFPYDFKYEVPKTYFE